MSATQLVEGIGLRACARNWISVPDWAKA